MNGNPLRVLAVLALVGLAVALLLWGRSRPSASHAAAAVVADGAGSSPLAAPRSVLVLDIDTLRADRLGAYGNQRLTSPTIDALAAEGYRFAWAFSQAPLTPPSQASILTGKYPSTHGVVGRGRRLSGEHVTLAEAFRWRGFRTAGFVDGGYMNRGFGTAQGFQTFVDRRTGLEKIGPQVVSWLEENGDEPFFMLVHTYDVHTPYDPPPEYRSLFLDGLEAPTPGFEPTSEALEAVRRAVWWDPEARLPERDVHYSLALYDAGIRYVDDWVGRFLDTLEELGLRDSTLVVVISDHGEEFQEHGSVLHEKLYTPVTHIPLILSFPGWQRSAVVTQTVQSIDLMPTLLDLIDAPIPKGVQGRSLVPLMEGRDTGEYPAFSESRLFGRQRTVAWGRFRFHYTIRGALTELFDFRADPLELQPLPEDDPRRLSLMRRALADWDDQLRAAPPPSTGVAKVRSETRDQLRALGYLQ
ncbi:MAG: sulfatase [Acidobacteriota bacterium]